MTADRLEPSAADYGFAGAVAEIKLAFHRVEETDVSHSARRQCAELARAPMHAAGVVVTRWMTSGSDRPRWRNLLAVVARSYTGPAMFQAWMSELIVPGSKPCASPALATCHVEAAGAVAHVEVHSAVDRRADRRADRSPLVQDALGARVIDVRDHVAADK